MSAHDGRVAADADVTFAQVAPRSARTEERFDPAWSIVEEPGNTLRRRVSEALFTIGDGGVATRGSVEEDGPDTAPGVLVNGVYTGTGPEQHLLDCPRWTGLTIDPPIDADERVLDLRDGVLYRREPGGDFRSLRFACADRPGVAVLRAEAAPGRLAPDPMLEPAPSSTDTTTTTVGEDQSLCLRTESSTGGVVVAVAAQRVTDEATHRRVDRIVAYQARPGIPDRFASARELGVDRLLAAHRATWAHRWEQVGIDLPDDPEVELAVRFSLFQLWSNTNAHGESAVGARGLSGPGYRGHVFWDADIFVLPAMASIDPDAAAAMLAYRLRGLPAARARARAEGARGARFPWESAADGTDVTPRNGYLGGVPVPILTGTQEEHITADIAWAADHFAEWTGRLDWLGTEGRELLTDTARYWVSRFRLDPDGRAHLDDVIGPDEYHESVCDNAFTNVLARWNLRRAARLEPRDAAEAAEFAAWRWLAERVVDQHHPDGRYEQFTGYFDLEPLLAAEVARPPVAADVLLGQARVAGSQLIKQPDVLMLHHLIPEEVDSLAANLDYYGPRTTHGSSLSPAIMAALLARAGRPHAALDMLRRALRIDMDDHTGTTAAGLHLAALAGVWQAMLTGFAGIRVRDGVLRIRPALPGGWGRFGIAFGCLGRWVRLDIGRDGVGIRCDGPLTVAVDDAPPILVSGETWCATKRQGV
ncbi:glycoside hydrolase family 65 protein [Nocardia arthritidis]|uniref:glycoside hydrolase family 65 protein n=1 Tax=Nocardia arthritidis TaxID=228602 RepID=UPI00142D3F3F|nr:glycoside hydrolase family 65 protein [Nocardia arthritidis]